MGYQALLFCPDEKAARAVTQVLSELDFNVEPSTEPFAAVKKLMAQHFDAVVVDCDNEQNATLLFKSARNSASNQSSLAVAVVEGQAGVAKAFRIGANLVLTKPINIEQAKGTLRVARGLLRKGSDPAKAATPNTGGAPAVPKAPAVPVRPAPLPSSVSAPVKPAPAAKPAAPTRPAADPTKDSGNRGEIAAQSTKPKIAPKPPAPPAITPAAATPAAAKKNFPWQPAKPGTEPIATAMKKAAGAGIATKPKPSLTSEVEPEVAHTTSPAISGAATAVAPAKQKSEAVAVPVMEPEVPVFKSHPVEEEPHAAAASASSISEREMEPPSFSMGAPAVDEEEPANSKKAIVIIAIVVILASMAGYLAWKNMSDKAPSAAPAAPAAQPAAPTSQAAPASVTPAVVASAPSASESTDDASSARNVAPVPPASKPSASSKAADTPAPKPVIAKETPAPAPAAPAIVVRNNASKPATKTASADADTAPAPNPLGMTSSSDAKALAAIGNAPVSVPKASSQTLKVSQGVSEGLILKKVQPQYPSQAQRMRIEGAVQLQATIGKDGSISNLKILSGDTLLAHAAMDAVRQWKYKPYYLNGDPVEIQTQITVNFKLPR